MGNKLCFEPKDETPSMLTSLIFKYNGPQTGYQCIYNSDQTDSSDLDSSTSVETTGSEEQETFFNVNLNDEGQ